MENPNWKDIIAGCARGIHAQQLQAYKLSWGAVYPAVYQMLKNKQEAEDALQESYLRAFKRIDELQDADKFVPWIKRICIREALNRLRQQKRMNQWFSDVREASWTDEDAAELDECPSEKILLKLKTLADGYQMIIRLHLLEGMSHEEIGETLGITASTSRSQYCRALKKLKDELITETTHEF